jgi:hypothetical protein
LGILKISAIIDINHVSGYVHHLYSDGDYDYSDSFVLSMHNFAPTDGKVDFLDFSDFEPPQMQCNDPQDPLCTPNW